MNEKTEATAQKILDAFLSSVDSASRPPMPKEDAIEFWQWLRAEASDQLSERIDALKGS